MARNVGSPQLLYELTRPIRIEAIAFSPLHRKNGDALRNALEQVRCVLHRLHETILARGPKRGGKLVEVARDASKLATEGLRTRRVKSSVDGGER